MRVKTEQGLTESGVQNMRTELKRILAQPFFWVFLAGCLFVNGWLLCNYAGQRERVLESVSAEEELGSIDEDSMAGYEERLRRFDSDEEGALTVGQMLRAAAAMKEELGAEDLADAYTGNYQLSGSAREYAEERFQRLEPILDENRENGTAEAFFIPGNENFFELLCRLIPFFCTLEGILAAVFLSLRCVTEPFASGTVELVFSCGTGRRIVRKKQSAGCLAGVLAGAFLWMATMTAAAVLFPLGDLWDTPVGSMMMLDGMCPLISEIPMTLRTYLFAQAGISILVGLLFSFAAGWAALRTRNALTAAAGLGIVCMAVYTLAELFPGVDKVWFWIRHNPVTFAADAGRWLVNGAFSLSSVWEAAAFGAGIMTFVITSSCRNYITAIAAQLPLLIAGIAFGIFFLKSFTEITQDRYLAFLIGIGWLAAGVLCGLVRYWAERRRDLADQG
ncbi:MAG: hypothetical protein ACLROY_13715 [Mediterraneibacter sp.]